jgi:hypothetical protein
VNRRRKARGTNAALALLSTVLVAVGAVACGSTGKSADDPSSSGTSTTVVTHNHAPSTTTAKTGTDTASSHGYLKDDGDKSGDDSLPGNPNAGDDVPFFKSYGRPAGPLTVQAVTKLIRSYLAAATTGDTAQACALLDRTLATGLAEDGPSPNSGTDCAAAVTPLFKQQQQQLSSDDAATIVVTAVLVKGNVGLAVLGFEAVPEGDILLEREDGRWRIGALLPSTIP